MWDGAGQLILFEYLVSVSDVLGDGALHQKWQSVLGSEVKRIKVFVRAGNIF